MSRQVCTFWVEELLFGLGLTDVQEIIRPQKMTRVPMAPAVIRGLIHLRGQIVTALDMRTRLGVATPGTEESMNVLVRSGGAPVALQVDEIGDVLEVQDDAWEKAPETLEGALRELVTGVYKLEGCLVLMLDVDRLTNLPASPRHGMAA